jgi:hypothetical protein
VVRSGVVCTTFARWAGDIAGRVNDRPASCATSGERKLACRRLADRPAGAENPIRPLYLDFRRGRLREGLGVALSFLYLEFLRMLRFLRLRRDDRADVAIELVMLRQGCRPLAVRWNASRY